MESQKHTPSNQKYTPSQARKIGAGKAFKYTLFAYLVLETWMFYAETGGDFANGILFFLDEQMNSLVLSVTLLLFICTFIFGRWAGRRILVDGKNHILIAILLTILTWGLLMGYLFLLSRVTGRAPAAWSAQALSTSLISLVIWLATTWSIKRKGTSLLFGKL